MAKEVKSNSALQVQIAASLSNRRQLRESLAKAEHDWTKNKLRSSLAELNKSLQDVDAKLRCSQMSPKGKAALKQLEMSLKSIAATYPKKALYFQRYEHRSVSIFVLKSPSTLEDGTSVKSKRGFGKFVYQDHPLVGTHFPRHDQIFEKVKEVINKCEDRETILSPVSGENAKKTLKAFSCFLPECSAGLDIKRNEKVTWNDDGVGGYSECVTSFNVGDSILVRINSLAE